MNNQLGGCGSAVGDCFDFWMRNAMAVADSVIAEPTLKTGDAPKHAAATAPLTMRFADPLTQGKGRWLGAIEPADQSWICFVGMDGRALLWEKRDTADGYSPRAGMGIGDPVVFERDLATLNISEASAVSLSGEPARDDQGRFSGAGGGSAARKFGESAGANAVRVGNDKASGIQARLASDTAGKASRDTIKTADAHRSSAVAHTAAAEAHARAVADGNGPAHHAASEAHTAAAVAHKQAADGMDKRAKDAAIINNKTDEHKAAVVRGAVAATQGARAVPGLAKFASLKAGDATSKAAGSGTASDHKMAANAHVTAAESHTAAATAAARGKLDATNVALDAAHDPTNGQFTGGGSGSSGSVDHQAMALASRAEADRHEAKAASLKKAGGFFNTNRAQVKIHTDLAKIHRDNADRSEEAHKAGGGKLSVDELEAVQLTEHGPDGKFAASGAAASAGMNVGFKAANHSSDDYKSVAAGHASNAAASASRTSHDNTQGSHVAAAAAHMAAARAHGEASLVTHGSDKTEHRDAQVAHEGAAKAHRDVAGPGAAHDDAVKKGDLSAQQGRGARDTSAVSGMAATASKGAGEATWKAGASGDAKDHKDAAQAHRDAASAHRDASTSAKQNSDSGQSHTSAAAAHKDAAAAHDMAAKARGSTLTALDVIEQLEITRDEKGQFSSAGGASEHVEAASHTAKSEGTREAHEAAAVAHSKAGDMHEAEGSHAKAEYHHEVAVDHATKDAPTRAEKSESTAKAAQEASTKAGSTGAAIDHQAAAVAHQAAFMANPNGPHADAHEHAAMEHSGKASAAIKAAGDGKAHERAIEAGRAAIPMASEHHDSAARGATGRAAALTENAHDSGSAADHKAAAEGHDDAAVAHEKAGQKDLAEGHTEAARAHHEAAEEARKGGKLTALATAAETHTAAAERSRLSVDLNTTITGGAPATNNSTEPADARAHTPEKLTMHKALAAYAAEKNLTKNQLVDRCKSAVPMALSESVTKALSDDEKDHPPPWLTKKIEGHLKALDDMEAGKKGEGDDDKPDSDRGEKMKALKAKADKAEEAKALMAQASAKEEEAKVLKAKALAVTGGPDPAPKNQIPLGASPLEQAVQGKLNSTSVGALTALGVAVGMNSADAEMHHDRVIRVALTSFEEQRELLTTFNVKSVKALRGKIEAMEDDAKAGKAASVQLAAIETERVHSAAAASVAQAEKEGRLTAEKKAKATGHLDAKRYEVLGAYLDACEPIAAFQNGAPSGGVTQLTVAQQDALRAAGAHPGAQGSEAPGKTEVGAPGTASKRSIEDMMNDPGVRESARALSILDNKPEFRAFCSALVDDAAGVTVTDRIATLSAHA